MLQFDSQAKTFFSVTVGSTEDTHHLEVSFHQNVRGSQRQIYF